MPASSVGAMNGWGVYLVAAFALLIVLAPALTSTASDSREGVDYRNADGVRAVLDSLRPGLRENLSFGPGPDPVLLGNGSVTCDYPGGSVSFPARWTLPDEALTPGVGYEAWVQGGTVWVVQDG